LIEFDHDVPFQHLCALIFRHVNAYRWWLTNTWR
jgi:hypothetical protein